MDEGPDVAGQPRRCRWQSRATDPRTVRIGRPRVIEFTGEVRARTNRQQRRRGRDGAAHLADRGEGWRPIGGRQQHENGDRNSKKHSPKVTAWGHVGMFTRGAAIAQRNCRKSAPEREKCLPRTRQRRLAWVEQPVLVAEWYPVQKELAADHRQDRPPLEAKVEPAHARPAQLEPERRL